MIPQSLFENDETLLIVEWYQSILVFLKPPQHHTLVVPLLLPSAVVNVDEFPPDYPAASINTSA